MGFVSRLVFGVLLIYSGIKALFARARQQKRASIRAGGLLGAFGVDDGESERCLETMATRCNPMQRRTPGFCHRS